MAESVSPLGAHLQTTGPASNAKRWMENHGNDFTEAFQENRCALQIADLYAHCSHSTKFEQLTQPIKNLEKERDEPETNVNTNVLREDTITSSEPEKDGDGGRERRQSEVRYKQLSQGDNKNTSNLK